MVVVIVNIALFTIMLVLLCFVLPRVMDKVANDNIKGLKERKNIYNF